MLNKYHLLLFLLALLGSCSSNEPTIHTNCQRDEIGNYILKWEITPDMEGTVSITVSDDPDRFDGPATKYVNIQDGVTTYVTNDNFDRKYFCLKYRMSATWAVTRTRKARPPNGERSSVPARSAT